jgi:Ca2+-binding RTX toxin-like protein
VATFTFETMTAAQAVSYNAATDQIVFSNPSAHATAIQVTFDTTITPPSPTIAGSTVVSGATITDLTTGHAVTFGSGVLGETDFVFGDGSKLFVGTADPDTTPASFARVRAQTAAFLSSGDDVFTAGAKGGVIQGNQGSDILTGGAAVDTIYGGSDGDTIDVGAGVNFAQGNKGDDVIIANGSSASNTLLGGQGDDSIAGGSGADFITGDLGNDILDGGLGGNDTLNGAAGDDSITSHEGAVSIDGGAGADSIDIATTKGARVFGGDGADTIYVHGVQASGSITINGNGGDDVISALNVGGAGASSILISGGQGNDQIAGSALVSNVLNGDLGDDSLIGGRAKDTISGGDGDDAIEGGGGADVLTGGAGSDTFRFAAGDSPATSVAGRDQILDWTGGGATAVDTLVFGDGGQVTAANHPTTYAEITATNLTDAATKVAAAFGQHFQVVAVQVGSDVVVFADAGATAGALDAADAAVVLVGRSLTDIDFNNID